jgi:hypothetical protein
MLPQERVSSEAQVKRSSFASSRRLTDPVCLPQGVLPEARLVVELGQEDRPEGQSR